ncbi:MAG: class I SAM-dependent methyltransferase [Thermodesulfobacteriota bacterium]
MNKLKSSWEIQENVKYFLESERGAVPGTEIQLAIISAIIRNWHSNPYKILDLGCGDGILGRFLLSAFPMAECVFLDFSNPMLDAARETLIERSDWTLVKADFSTPDWLGAVESFKPFDVVISGFAIHHQPDIRKKGLYNEIYDLLTKGGIFLNLEHVKSSTDNVERLFEEYYADHLHAHQLKTNPDASREDILDGFKNRPDKDEDQLSPVEEQCQWLTEIGFKDVDCYYKQFEIALFGGRKF